MRPLLIALLIVSFGADAAAKRPKKRRRDPAPAGPQTQKPDPKPTPAPAKESLDTASLSVADKLVQARRLADELDYPKVATLTQDVIEDPAASPEQKLDAYRLLGSAQAFMGNPLEAESAFRFLLRGQPDFEFPEGTSPKITWVFRKVQHEEQEILKQTQEMRRARIAAAMELGLNAPERGIGGEPLRFELKIKDPFGAVEVASLHYRKTDEPRFSQLPLKLDETGKWTAALPAEWTANESGATVEYFVGAEDSQKLLLRSVGSESDPLRLSLEAGAPPSNEPIYSRWWFWAGSIAALAGLSVATALVIDAQTSVPTGDIDPVPLD